MSLFKTISPILAAGAVIKMKLSAAADGKIQLDMIPEVDTKATGIVVPAQSFTATPEELDNELGPQLASLVSDTVTLSNQVAVAQAVMEDAKAKAQEAVKSAAKTPAKPGTARTTSATAAKPANAGLSLGDEDDDVTPTGGDGESTNGAQPAAATAGGDDGLIQLF